MRTNLTRIQVTDLILPTCAREKDEKVCMSEKERERERERERESESVNHTIWHLSVELLIEIQPCR